MAPEPNKRGKKKRGKKRESNEDSRTGGFPKAHGEATYKNNKTEKEKKEE